MKSLPRRVTIGALIAASAVAVAGCKNEALPGPQPREPDFNVNVAFPQGSNLTPRYSWGAGDAASLRVQQTTAFSEPAWIVVTENASGPVNGISSPVTHGTTPPGAQVDAANELELLPGVAYQVVVGRADGTAGFREFTCCN